jgi:hypothetical protein
MSYLIYNESEPKRHVPLGRLNPNRQYRKHLENWFFLKLILRNGNIVERHQASKELAICDRKLEYWQKRSNFDTKQAELDLIELKKQWK